MTLATAGPSTPVVRGRRFVAQPVKQDVLRGCLYLTIVFSVSRIHQEFNFIAVFRPAMILVIVALFAAIAKPAALAKNGWEKRWPIKFLAGLTFLVLGSIAFGISQGAAFLYFTQDVSKVLGCAILMITAIRQPRDLWRFVWAYVVGSAILVWMALFFFDLTPNENGFSRLGNLDTWDANDICVVLEMGLGCCLLLMRTSKGFAKATAGVIALGIGAAVARSGSRGGFLGLGVFVIAYLFSLKGTSVVKRIGVVVALVGGLTIAAPAGYWKQMNTITSSEDYNYTTTQGRKALAIRGMGYMFSHPIFGLGIGNFGRAEAFLSGLDDGVHGVKWSVAHNTYVQAGAEMGVGGFVLFAGMVVGCVVAPWKLRRRIPESWATGNWDEQFLYQSAVYMPLAALGFAVPAYFVSFAYADPVYILLAMTSGLIACVETRLAQPAGAPPPRRSAVSGGRAARGRFVAAAPERTAAMRNSLTVRPPPATPGRPARP